MWRYLYLKDCMVLRSKHSPGKLFLEGTTRLIKNNKYKYITTVNIQLISVAPIACIISEV